MTDIGYKLICETHGPNDLVEYAQLASNSAFEFAMISDHFHPWLSEQGESPLVWNVIGAIAQATDGLDLGTAVTCPTIRYHPTIVAQAAATSAAMVDGEFFLGVGTGENLSEHIQGDRWPEHDVRLAKLEEAIEVIRGLWTGENYSHHGEHYTVENAKLFTLPENGETPDIHVAADGPNAARLAGEAGDGFIGVEPDPELLETYAAAGGGDDAPRYGETAVCWAADEDEAIETAHELWRHEALPGQLLWDIPTTAHFDQATAEVTEEDIAELIVCGNDPEEHIETIQEYVDAGYDNVAIHQIGSEQEGFVEFYEDEVLPAID